MVNYIHKFIVEFRTNENRTGCEKIAAGIKYFSIFGVCLFILIIFPQFLGYLAINNPKWMFKQGTPLGAVGFVIILCLSGLFIVEVIHMVLYIHFVMSSTITKKFKTNEVDLERQNKDLWVLDSQCTGYDHKNKSYSYRYEYLSSNEVIRIIIAYITNLSGICFFLYNLKVFDAIIIYVFGSFVIDVVLLIIIMAIKNIRIVLSKSE